ncbi:MAG: tetratricopeptide repeat protein [Acidobacteria bacterium]|nr:tetratricopeptide repeat protein [Acidobacteriota bacterium]
MDLPVTALLTAALTGMKWLARNSQSKPDLGSDKSLAAELAEVLVSAVLGNRADAAAAGWLARMKKHWVRVDVDGNHDLLRAVTMASWFASYRVGLEYGSVRNLQTEHWSDRLQVGDHLRRWLRRPCASASSLFREAEAQWLDRYLPGVLQELDRAASEDWQAPDGETELARVTESLPDGDAESVLGRRLTAEALEDVRARWGDAPAGFVHAFERDWFRLFCAAFQARLKDDQRVANIFFAGQLAALRSAPGGALLQDSALTALRGWLDSVLDEVRDVHATLREFREEYRRDRARVLVEEYPPPDLPPVVDGLLPPPVKLPPRSCFNFASMGDRFVGRSAEIWQVHRALEGGSCVISGGPGFGKSQLAIEYAHRFGRFYPGGVYWVEAEGGKKGAEGRRVFVRQMKVFLEASIDDSLDLDVQLTLLWRKVAGLGARALVVLNNFRESEELRPYLPADVSVAAVLVTTRRRGLAAAEVPLDSFSAEESLALLNSGEREYTMESAGVLIDALGGMPLALELARGVLEAEPSLSVLRFMERLVGAAEGWQEFAKYHEGLPSRHVKDIAATIRLSWDSIQEDDARDVLQAMSLLAPEPVPLRVLEHIPWFSGEEGKEDLLASVDELVNLSLLERVDLGEGEQAVQAHRMVLEFVRRSEPAEYSMFERVLEGAVAEMRFIFDQRGIVENARWLAWIQPHALLLVESERCGAASKLSLAESIGEYEEFLGHYEEALYWAQMSLDLAQRHFRQEPWRIAKTRGTLAWLHQLLGHYIKAEMLAREVLRYWEKAASPGDVAIASAQCALGEIVSHLGRYEEARKLLQGALAAEKAAYPEGHPEIAVSQHALGKVLSELGRYEEARKLLEESLAATKAVYPEGHPSIAVGQHDLGRVLSNLGRYEEARKLLEESLAATKAAYPEGHPHIAVSQHVLGEVLSKLGSYEEARKLLEEAVAATKAAYPAGHPYIAISLVALGRVLLYLGDSGLAAPLIQTALPMLEAAYPGGHEHIVRARAYVGLVEILDGRAASGWERLREAQAQLEERLGTGHYYCRQLRSDLERLLQAPQG